MSDILLYNGIWYVKATSHYIFHFIPMSLFLKNKNEEGIMSLLVWFKNIARLISS